MINTANQCIRWLRDHLNRRHALACLLVPIVAAATHVRFRAQDAVHAASPKLARDEGQPIPVRTTTVTECDVVEVIGATAVTAPSLTVKVISGKASDPGPRDYCVRSVPAVPGRFVPKGTLLFEFDDTVFHQVVRHRQAELAAAAQIRETPGRHQTRQEVLDAEASYERARLALDLARLDLESCRLVSTVDGFVGEVNLAPGDRVEFGRNLTEVMQLHPVHVVMDLPQERIDQVRTGQTAEVVLDSFPQQTFLGKVVQVPPAADPRTRTVPVVVEVPNPDYRVKAGVSGFVRVRVTKNTLAVPSVAAIRQGNKAMVFRVESNRAHIREVRVGQVLEPGQVEVLAGLSAGDEVVIFGAQYLKDNDLVNTNWKAWSGRRNR